MAKQEIKTLTAGKIKPTVVDNFDKSQGMLSNSRITQKENLTPRKKRKTKRKKQEVPPKHDHQEGRFPGFVLICHYCNVKGHIRPKCYKYIKQCKWGKMNQKIERKNVMKVWIRNNELWGIEHNGIIWLKKSGDKYVVIKSQLVEQNSSKEFWQGS